MIILAHPTLRLFDADNNTHTHQRLKENGLIPVVSGRVVRLQQTRPPRQPATVIDLYSMDDDGPFGGDAA
ncbi:MULTISPECIES: hypothetical protein [unclassified Oceanobacter]|uniref:hypothetical protein n=1 Tax=unclassified Oceanobacter TaxID=2620260 RepID=UPI002736D8B4|nr:MULTISPECIES: hypothetical protein [unclassified Oceanobacter]MDP2610047.1 hypothetical protein [Oceanobacter sp. 1_MG-2023]MDP2613317.1 hypothetical protein [Oceanobacter sp. 2_MG-2023]